MPCYAVAAGTLQQHEALLELLELPSGYADGAVKVEGTYLRIDDEESGQTRRRGKIVRPDFIQGIAEHFKRGGLVKQGLRIAARYCGEYAEWDAQEAGENGPSEAGRGTRGTPLERYRASLRIGDEES